LEFSDIPGNPTAPGVLTAPSIRNFETVLIVQESSKNLRFPDLGSLPQLADGDISSAYQLSEDPIQATFGKAMLSHKACIIQA
jgi:hypothetical protein